MPLRLECKGSSVVGGFDHGGVSMSRVELSGVHGLGLEQPDDRLHHGVVLRVAHRPDRRHDAFHGQVLGVVQGGASPDSPGGCNTSLLK